MTVLNYTLSGKNEPFSGNGLWQHTGANAASLYSGKANLTVYYTSGTVQHAFSDNLPL